jgi:hypothetical protein
MFLVDYGDGSADNTPSAQEAAAKALRPEPCDVTYDSELERRAYVAAHDAIVSRQIQQGVGFGS